jgi:hypothetical protein
MVFLMMRRLIVFLAILNLNFGTTRSVSGSPIFDPTNGHYYEVIVSTGGWERANVIAQSLTYNGLQGYLATVTSQAENDFINSNLPGATQYGQTWIGGYQDLSAPDYSEPAGGWRWVIACFLRTGLPRRTRS